ncbi:MAG TPA: FAD-dependent oxidoreductase [Thermodesulfobacteriota bacterium]|nr:FAD-dependent oxidoreductase [Thermodesulfobacteriota bacterium]
MKKPKPKKVPAGKSKRAHAVKSRAAQKRTPARKTSPAPKGSAYDADVLIVGYGAAGANAAIAARDAGAKVIVLEKLGFPGGNSGVCAGAMVVPESLEEAVRYYRALSFGTVDEDLVRAFAEQMVGIPRLLAGMGAEFKVFRTEPAYFPSFLHGKVQRIMFNPTGVDGFRFLDKLVRERNIEVMMNTTAVSLVRDADTGEVLGVKAGQDGKEITLLARRGVILTCGGYGYNKTMMADFNFPGAAEYIFPWGTPGNTGDGIKLATEAGAALWHMASLEWGAFCARQPSLEFGTAVGTGIARSRPEGSFVFVNRSGKRFMPEDTKLIHRKAPLEILFFDHEKAEYRNLPAFMVCDEEYQRKGPVTSTREDFMDMWGGPVGYAMVRKIYEWSGDNGEEIRKGWLVKADSLGELAGKIGADAPALEETIREYNAACREGRDAQFGRTPKTLAPLETPPYYAVELGLTLVNTQGGPKHNNECQVLDYQDKPIPRLYAAGELGSFFGFLYQGGTNYPEAWAFGQIAGRRAASEIPRK